MQSRGTLSRSTSYLSGDEARFGGDSSQRAPASQPLHLTAAALQFLEVQRLTGRRGK
jgi:hypothetical protein